MPASVPPRVRPLALTTLPLPAFLSTKLAEVALTLAREKARTVAAMSEAAYVVGCDQTLALGERRFSKPVDRAAARDQLERTERTCATN